MADSQQRSRWRAMWKPLLAAVGSAALVATAVVAVTSGAPAATADSAPAQAPAGQAIEAEALLAAPTSSKACSPFPDIDSSNTHCANINWLMGAAITKPADGLYHGEDSVTRGSMTAFLFRLTNPGKPSPTCTTKPFPDVPTSHLFCGYIQWAAKNKIAFGYADRTFGPENAVTRGAMAAFLKRIVDSSPTASCSTKPFTDVATSDTFCGVINWAAQNGITYGVGDGSRYGTTQPVTRQSMASFLRRIAQQPVEIGDSYVLVVDGNEALQISVKSVKFDGRSSITATVSMKALPGLKATSAGKYRFDPAEWFTGNADGQSRKKPASGAPGSTGARNVTPGTSVTAKVVIPGAAHGTVGLSAAGYDDILWRY